MKALKALRTTALCAMTTALSLTGMSNAHAQSEAISETYNLSSVNINYGRNGDINLSFVGTSELDKKTQKYKSGSEQLTRMSLVTYDSAMKGQMGAEKHDARLRDVIIEYTNPTVNRRGNISGYILNYKYGMSKVKDLGYVTSDFADSGFSIDTIYFSGKNIDININNVRNGSMARTAVGQIESATTPTVGRAITIDYFNTSREMFPKNGTVQLPGIVEKFQP